MDDAWRTINQIVSWLDANSILPPETEKLLRIMKLTEEAGEVTQAVIGAMGQNPRSPAPPPPEPPIGRQR
jgi:hypothetical protein